MKYRHSFHAGNFADVHKHVTLLALLRALQRKEKGFLYLETHAGRGAYDLSQEASEAQGGIARFAAGAASSEELRHYATRIDEYRRQENKPHAYPGSPLLAVSELRPQDRAVLIELMPAEARALELAIGNNSRVRVERGDGFERLRAWLPPQERRGLTFMDPPYEETSRDFERIGSALAAALRRFQTGIIAVWYPIKDERTTAAWQAGLARNLSCETLVGELWLYPRDSRVALNGSGMLIVNPPYLLAERMRVWLPELQAQLDVARTGGTSIRSLGEIR
ncbi:MAG TPA: 23S rRNA (adenine(2030)-N(6))-methyltransferase RlmJ [Steroidobacteraceae bacterium]|nr:23S rRNA (adenine(2030)-N(6))-methyltransferase RlmJ [Steroidobacteraceae bacterium]